MQKYKYLAQYDGSVYTYPAWAHWTGRILAASTMSCIPIGAIVALIKARVSIDCQCKFLPKHKIYWLSMKYLTLRGPKDQARLAHSANASGRP